MGLISRVSSRTYRESPLPLTMSYEYVYILQLDNDKIYVGKSANPEQALFDHKYNKIQCEWTQLYKPVGEGGFMMAPYIGSDTDVDDVTYQLMIQYGYENVRNCTQYTTKELNATQIKTLKDSLGGSDEMKACARCGRMYHTQNCCTVYRDILGKVIDEIPEPYKPPEIPEKKQKLEEKESTKNSKPSTRTGGSTTTETDEEYIDGEESIEDVCVERGQLL